MVKKYQINNIDPSMNQVDKCICFVMLIPLGVGR